MAIPKIRELYNPILDYLYKFGESSVAEIRIAMARSFYIHHSGTQGIPRLHGQFQDLHQFPLGQEAEEEPQGKPDDL